MCFASTSTSPHSFCTIGSQASVQSCCCKSSCSEPPSSALRASRQACSASVCVCVCDCQLPSCLYLCLVVLKLSQAQLELLNLIATNTDLIARLPCQACNDQAAGGGSPSIQDAMAHAEAALHQLKEVVEKESWHKQGIQAAVQRKEAELKVKLVQSMSSALLLDFTRRVSHETACSYMKLNVLTTFCTAHWHAACCKLTSVHGMGLQLHRTSEADSIPSQLARMNGNCNYTALQVSLMSANKCCTRLSALRVAGSASGGGQPGTEQASRP